VQRHVTRRNVLKGITGAAALLGADGLITACDGTAQKGSVLKVGYVSPVTGAAAAFAEPNSHLLKKVTEALAGGISAGGQKYRVEIIDRDSKSDPQTAAQVAAELITSQKVDLMLCTSTPETVNPVSDACEAAHLPCLSTVVPWEAWYFGRGATAAKPFTYTYHFFVGVAQFATAYRALWTRGDIQTNNVLGVMWPNDPDGKAIRQGLGPALKQAGFSIVDPGAYQDGTSDYSRQISTLKVADAQIFNTFPIPTDFIPFWQQARRAGYRPKVATVAKTGLFPSQVEALGDLGYGLSAGFWWTPQFPYTCTLTLQTAQELADDYRSSTGKPWTQMVGSNMALFEVGVAALKNCSDPKNRQELAAALGKTKLVTVVGPLDWTAGPVKNVSIEPLVMGQWRRAEAGSPSPVEPVIVDNTAFQEIPIAGTLERFS
jgi:branched-chain amino acid transport system substrate-binding protein